MRLRTFFSCFVTGILFTSFLFSSVVVYASPLGSNLEQSGGVTAYDLIVAMNTLRMSYGLPALIEDPIINAVAQSTAEIMAANNMSWHIGDVRGRLKAAGYGGGATVWATENFAVGNLSIDEIMQVWSDSEHMRPAVTPAYCHVGAGVARTADGRYYYVLQAAYISEHACGAYTSVPGSGSQSGVNPVSQVIVPVKIATPDAEGRIYHVVEQGQSFWAIAIAYKITIRDIEIWNNLSRTSVLRPGQRLFIPSSSTEGYATPTPVGMIIPATPDADGRIVHVVQPYQALIPIAKAYGVTVEAILALNGLQVDVPLQIGQKLLISPGWVTPSPTPRPLTPLEKLTPASDGKYYHIVRSGENLSWIARLYDISVNDLMAWNGLNASSIIQPDQKLLLQVTPPATPTPTPAPPTATAPATLTPIPPPRTLAPTQTLPSPTDTPIPESPADGFPLGWVIFAFLAVAGPILFLLVTRKKTPHQEKPL